MISKALRRVLARLAAWIVRFPRLKQRVLRLVSLAPAPVEARLRRWVAPGGAAGAPPEIAPDPVSPAEKRLLRDLAYREAQRQRAAGQQQERPRLAYFSPLPPEKSGISQYSLMLLPVLARYYEITAIVHQTDVDAGDLGTTCEVRPYHWFVEHAGEFDRILYHMGNSHFHTHMFEALENYPGVVVLHDFFLGHVIRHMDYRAPGYLGRSLYRGWGFTGLSRAAANLHSEEVIWDCPLNADVLAEASGIIVHSPVSRALAQQHYGDHCRQDWHVIPHLREPAAAADRTAARTELGLPTDAFVVCSFGHITPTKYHDRILRAWQTSALNDNPDCWLVFVGELAEGTHGRTIGKLIRTLDNPRIRVTGWADGPTFEHYLAAADAAVQLRSRSRGETSGAAIDCLNHGLPTIVNAHGTMADLPEDSVCMLPDRFSDDELVSALEKILDEPPYRRALAEAARKTIRTNHNPGHCGELYHTAIETVYRQRQDYVAALDQVLDGTPQPRADNLRASLPDLKPHLPRPLRQTQLLVDVSAIVHTDLKTGIERVVRAQLLELISNPPPGYRVEPVYLHRQEESWHLHYARAYGWYLLDLPGAAPADEKVDAAAGDILYMPDLNAHSIVLAHGEGLFRRLREQGVAIHVLIHDVLPVSLPECFPSGAKDAHEAWLRAITGFAHQIICISRAVADQYCQWRKEKKVPAPLPPVVVNHHGADIEASRPSTGFPPKGKSVLARLEAGATFLMVGTVEPRKGYLTALDAFDQLWREGADVNLVIVGKEGWKNLPPAERRNIPETVRKLDWHPQRNKRLFWLSDISDQYLEAIYAVSDCLIAASYDEGFGLPLIEAAQHKLAIIARDIPVFREVAGDHAQYFEDGANPLAEVMRRWLAGHEAGEPTSSAGMPARTWTENVAALKRLLV